MLYVGLCKFHHSTTVVSFFYLFRGYSNWSFLLVFPLRSRHVAIVILNPGCADETPHDPAFCFHPRQVIVKSVSIEQCLGIKGSLKYLTHTFCSTSLSCPLPHWALWELWVQTFKFGVGDVRRSHLLSPWETRASFGRSIDERRRKREREKGKNSGWKWLSGARPVNGFHRGISFN